MPTANSVVEMLLLLLTAMISKYAKFEFCIIFEKTQYGEVMRDLKKV